MSFPPQEALQELYINHRGDLESLLFNRLHCQDTASDISQEAFVRKQSAAPPAERLSFQSVF